MKKKTRQETRKSQISWSWIIFSWRNSNVGLVMLSPGQSRQNFRWDFLFSLFFVHPIGEVSYFHFHFFSFNFHSGYVSVFHFSPHETVFPGQNFKDISNGDAPYPGFTLIQYFVLLTNAGLKLFAARTSPFSDCSFWQMHFLPGWTI